MDGSFLGPLSGLYAILHIVCDLITCLFHAELPMQERELYVVKPHSIYCSNLFSAVWQAATEEANAQQVGHALVANELLSSALCCVRAILQQLAVTYCQPFTFHVTVSTTHCKAATASSALDSYIATQGWFTIPYTYSATQ